MVCLFRYNISFRLDPFSHEDANGRKRFDFNSGITASVNYEGAAALYIAAKNIVFGKAESNGMRLTISCRNGVNLMLERCLASNNDGQGEQMETFLCIIKGNVIIPFKFQRHLVEVKENDRIVTKSIESGLAAFGKTIEGYLTGIGSDLHLSKLPENFDELDSMTQKSPNTTGRNGYQISYGNFQNTPPSNFPNTPNNYQNTPRYGQA
ncbi:MAG: hypothetical protein FWH04_10395 [Oscillospiraceae bacterium]|nr:hypothetical protein [Oscillospiraceae bacterium]